MSVPTAKLSFPGGPVKSASFSTGLFINNKFVAAADGKTFEVVNPATEEKIADVAEAGQEDIDRAVAAAQKAYETWGRKLPGHERGALLTKLAELIEEHADEIAAIETLDNGKSLGDARGWDIPEVARCLRYYAGWADKNHGRTIEVDPTRHVYTVHEPFGVVGQIIPWNFPCVMLAWKLGPALATGNTVVLKTAEQTPLAALRIAELIAQVFPPGVVNIVSGFGARTGAAIVSHPKIEKVAFTGSTITGRTIMKAAADSNLKNVTLELGGKSAVIVFEDADIESAVAWISFGILFNIGQCCCAGSRVFVHDSIFDNFIDALKEEFTKWRVGSPFETGITQGPVVSKVQFDRVMGYIKAGQDEGATCAIGGKRHGDKGYFIEPTVFTNVKSNMKIVQEEIFGPVICVDKFSNEEAVIKEANNSDYGLAAAVYTRDISRAIRVSHSLEAGTVWTNQHNQLHAGVPFGGYKQSGIGRELGENALANYTQVKTVNVNLNRRFPTD